MTDNNDMNHELIESAYQAASNFSKFEVNFAGTAGEGYFWGFRNQNGVGEGIWITNFSLIFSSRNYTLNDGTWVSRRIISF